MPSASDCARRACSTCAPTSAATRSSKSPSPHPNRATSAPANCCARWPSFTRRIHGPECGPRSDMAKVKSKAAYMISVESEQCAIPPHTLRLYEREGLLKPSRREGNPRLYTPEDLERLEVILHLTRDLGVNLAGVEIILNMREKMSGIDRKSV